MIVGVGVDLVSVSRFRSDWEARPQDFEDTFTGTELSYALAKPAPEKFCVLAARLAAKEAFLKARAFMERAFPEGWKPEYYISNPVLRDIEIQNDPKGRPFFSLRGRIGEKAKALPCALHLSLSHEADMAIALVVCEKV